MSSHIAAEFAGKCVIDREPLPAISLAESSTVITAVGNDYGFDQVFVRGVRAHGRAGDVLLAMSTSGDVAQRPRGAGGGAGPRAARPSCSPGSRPTLTALADHVLRAPSTYTPRIQEVHLMWSHAWCEGVDTAWAAGADRRHAAGARGTSCSLTVTARSTSGSRATSMTPMRWSSSPARRRLLPG